MHTVPARLPTRWRIFRIASVILIAAAAGLAAPMAAGAATPASAPAPSTAEPGAPVAAGPIEARAIDPRAGLHELSPVSMFMAADVVVKGVMGLLAFASLASWTVLIAKSAELIGAGRALRGALKRAATARTLDEAGRVAEAGGRGVFARLVAAAEMEAQLSREVGAAGAADGIKERAASAFAEITRGEARSVRRGLGLLATIGSVAPFVGLFGTVWGIMNAFIGISKSQTTNLAVVAPGIAEALLATAVGLVAAIPAVIIYNHFSRQVRGYLDVVAAAAGAAGRLLSRDLDRRRHEAGERRFTAAAE